jgi:hypothetical protein
VILHHEIDRSIAVLSKDWQMAAYIDSQAHISYKLPRKGWRCREKKKKRCK